MELRNKMVKFNYAPNDHRIFVRVYDPDNIEGDPEIEFKVRNFTCLCPCMAVLTEPEWPGGKRRMHMEAISGTIHFDSTEDLIVIS